MGIKRVIKHFTLAGKGLEFPCHGKEHSPHKGREPMFDGWCYYPNDWLGELIAPYDVCDVDLAPEWYYTLRSILPYREFSGDPWIDWHETKAIVRSKFRLCRYGSHDWAYYKIADDKTTCGHCGLVVAGKAF